ncbi:hypothetical protein C2G38_2252435 [Gigaspora rosea]|uniref:Uncharacterized protein n=1 Tax=Gigaspora rosea TaxID=44941 RepID=A0A397UC14_9GLOM|nr:hypothetical protein C2G38_2252435 [Gigaspora rosea]
MRTNMPPFSGWQSSTDYNFATCIRILIIVASSLIIQSYCLLKFFFFVNVRSLKKSNVLIIIKFKLSYSMNEKMSKHDRSFMT